MIKHGLATLLVYIVACSATHALARSGNTSVSTGSASATVAVPVKLTAISALQFGTLAQPVADRTMAIAPPGGFATTSDLGCVIAIAQSAPPAAASFTVSGISGAIFAASGVSQATIGAGSAKIMLGPLTGHFPVDRSVLTVP